MKIESLNLYLYAKNLLTWTSYSGLDPEFTSYDPIQIGEDRGRYPRQKELGLGITLNF